MRPINQPTIPGSSWKNSWIFVEKFLDLRGKFLDLRGKIPGSSWKIPGSSWEVPGSSWKNPGHVVMLLGCYCYEYMMFSKVDIVFILGTIFIWNNLCSFQDFLLKDIIL